MLWVKYAVYEVDVQIKILSVFETNEKNKTIAET